MTESNISLHRHESLRIGLLRVVDAMTDSVSGSLAHVANNGEPDIHLVRTTIKRLRALLRLIRPAIDPAFFDRENRRLRTAAGLMSFARDAEVASVTLKGLPVSDQADQDAVQSVLAGFENRAEAPPDLDHVVAEVRRYLEQTRRNLHRLTLRGSEREILKSGLRAVYRQGRKRMRVALEQGQDNAFHRWRIRAKNLYYELEFLELFWPKRFHLLVSRLAELQDQIGLDHDAAVLRAWLKKTPEQFGGSENVERVVRQLDSQTRKLRKRTVPLGRKIWRQNPRRFASQIVRHWPKHKQV
ncbi:MAG: CHAD domain-containing protein [Verrucomicrobia bacterium]|nr:CHAD domain-containing protein [Verrucomicrobiota bacterium]